MGVSREKREESPQAEAVVRADSEPTRSRKPYRKPAFRYERVFETMALSCGKLSPTQSQCITHPNTS
jgi:hypothetical protein